MFNYYLLREALIDALMSYSWRDENDFSIDDADEKRKYIEGWLPNIPAADVAEVRRGHWIKRIDHYDCSVCADSCWADSAPEYYYCPTCGAKMDESEGSK